jgi:TctA family transporter
MNNFCCLRIQWDYYEGEGFGEVMVMIHLFKISEALCHAHEQLKGERPKEAGIEKLKQAQDEWKQAMTHALSNTFK